MRLCFGQTHRLDTTRKEAILASMNRHQPPDDASPPTLSRDVPVRRVLAVCLSLALITACAFSAVIRSDFIKVDDPLYVTANPHVRNGLTEKELWWAFTAFHAGNWHPLTWLSHMTDVQLFGLYAGAHHATSLLFHIANAVLLFLVLFSITKALWRSAFVAALFALHPLHVESVAWVAERKDVLSGFLWFLAMGAYTRYARNSRPGTYATVLGCFVLGLASKPMLVTLPFALLLLDWWPLGRLGRTGAVTTPRLPVPGRAPGELKRQRMDDSTCARDSQAPGAFRDRRPPVRSLGFLLAEKIPLFTMAAASSIVTYVAQWEGGAVQPIAMLPTATRIGNAFVSYEAYMEKTLWPSGLAFFYPFQSSLPAWEMVASMVLFMAATAAVFLGAKKSPYLAVGWLWYAGTLVPVIGILQVGMQARADRYTYIPLVGLFIIAAWGIPDLLRGWKKRAVAMGVASSAVLCALFTATWLQVGYWRDSFALFDHALDVTGPNAVVLNYRAAAYNSIGKPALAMSDLSAAIAIDPGYAHSYNNRGIALQSLGQLPRAEADYTEAIRIDPGYVDAYVNRGIVLEAMSDPRRAVGDLTSAIRINPGRADAYYNRANADYALGDPGRAIADLSAAIAIDPGYVDAYNNRGALYNTVGDYAKAVSDLDRAIEMEPAYANAYLNRGVAYGYLGDRARALADLREAAALGNNMAKKLLVSQGKNP